jgi:signal transduction histidine kinase
LVSGKPLMFSRNAYTTILKGRPHVKHNKGEFMVKQQGIFSRLNRRWLLILSGLLTQCIILTLAFIGSLQSGQPDVTLAPVAGNPNACRITHVTAFTDAWINGIQPGMLVQQDIGPVPGFPTNDTGTLVHCQIVENPVYVQIIGQDTILRISPAASPFANIPDLIASLFLTIIFHLTGITIFLRAPNRPVARIAYSLFYFVSLILFLLNIHNILWVNVLVYVLNLCTWGIAATFVCLLPHPVRQQSRRNRLHISPYTPLITGMMLTVISLPIIVLFSGVRAFASTTENIYSSACVITIMWTMFWGLRRTASGERHIIRMIAVGIAFLLLASTIDHNVARYSSVAVVEFNHFTKLFTVPVAILPFVCGYALIRHQFLGTKLFSRQAIRILLWLWLASFFIIPTITLSHAIASTFSSQEVQGYCYAAILLLDFLLFPLAWNKVRNIGDQVFYHDFYEYNRELRELSVELTRLQHLDQICTFVLPRLATLLNATGAALLVRTPGHSKGQISAGNAAQSWRIYHDAGQPFLPINRLTSIANLALTHLKEFSAEPLVLDGVLLLALYDGDFLSGFLCIGAKLNFEPYSRQDKSFLSTLAAQLSVLEVNSRYLEHAQADAQMLAALHRRVISAQEDERRHLALELHDEVLQQAMLMVRQLSDASSMTDIAEIMPLARALVTSLRHTCLELRPPLLDELGLEEALNWLAHQTEQRSELGGASRLQINITCSATEHTGFPSLSRLPSEVELAFYRVAQEALSNILKHARADRVTMRLRRYAHGSVSLLICDNGRGFTKNQSTTESLGLISMHERMLAVDGQLQLRTSPGSGVIVRAIYRSGEDAEEDISQTPISYTLMHKEEEEKLRL